MNSALLRLILLTAIICAGDPGQSQDKVAGPSFITTGRYLGETPPLRDLPVITEAEWLQMEKEAGQKLLNPELEHRSYPFSATAFPRGMDPVWQRTTGQPGGSRAPIVNFQAQSCPYYPPDANGTAGPDHYMQTVNATYAIYDKTGNRLAGPTALNTLFSGVPGSSCNNGDPIVLFDEQADRWLVAEFSICIPDDSMLIAVSTTNDPTGTWHKYSFDVDDLPDYPKFGIWQDGYYMGTNNGGTGKKDIYVFERSQMLSGGTAVGVGFDNPWRPTTNDGFMCVPPLDNDGPFAPSGSPGLFITITDDAIAGGTDQIWIYELDVDWTTPANSTFSLTQQINVAPFDSDFGNNWNNIEQPGTNQELDAIPQVIMNPPQYRNFGTYQAIVCCHTVDVDNSDHAGIRWYELRKTGSSWSVRQQGTYAPDIHSRWMGSIMLNGSGQIALGYSISSSTVYPGIRYCGQSSDAFASASGMMDIPEEIIRTGTHSQTATNRWGDYSSMQIDPPDDSAFWFTSEYIGTGGARYTRIASFKLPDAPGRWIGNVSGDWNTAANWSGNHVPDSLVSVYIHEDAQYWPVYTGNLTLGTACRDIFMDSTSRLTVTGNLHIPIGREMILDGPVLLNVGGNFNCQGTFEPSTGIVNFNGTSNSTVTGNIPADIIISNYSRNMIPAGMTPLTDPVPGPEGTNGFADVPIGFSFNFAGSEYTEARISTNGWISLDLSGSTTNDNAVLFSPDNPNATLAPWFDYLTDDATSMVSYKTEGTEPYRIFTVEWYRVPTYWHGATARISFQVKLKETTNVIEFHYGSLESGTHSNQESASIGLEDGTGGSGHFIEATTGSMDYGITNLVSNTGWPAVNYRFSPPPMQLHFHSITINNPGGNVHFDISTAVYNDFNVMPGGSFTVGSGKTMELK